MAVDARGARESLKAICDLLGGLTLDTDQVRRWMASRGGCAVEGPTRLEPGGLCRPGPFAPERAGALVRVEVGGAALSALCPEEQRGRSVPVLDREVVRTLAETRRYMEEHLDEPLTISDFEPPGLPLRHHIQGGVPPPVRSAGPHLAAAAEDGACGGVAAGLLPQRAGGSPVSGIQQRQPVLRRLPAAVRHVANHVSKNV